MTIFSTAHYVCVISNSQTPFLLKVYLPTAAVVIRSWPCPTWSAWAFVRSSIIVSRASDRRGKYCKFRSSLIRVLQKQIIFTILFTTRHFEVDTYLCLFKGVLLFSSAVGTNCSPERIHKIGPSFDKRGSVCRIEYGPHGIV